MLCDGRIVCGCADPYGKRVLGDARTASRARGLDRAAIIARCATDLNAGGSKFCGDCPLKLPLKKDEAPPVRPLDAGPLPSRMYIECTAACNISCTEACCAPETGITRTRQAGMLDFDLFRRVIDEVGPSLGRIDFFNYGEAFLHKRAIEMCEYIKTQLSAHLSLHEHQRPRAHRGAGAAARALRHRRGHVFDRRRHAGELRQVPAARPLRRRARATCARWPTRSAARAATCRSSTGATSCSTGTTATRRWTWRGELAADIGVDRLCWEMTDHPEDAFSRRFVPGIAGARRDPPRDLGRQQSRQRDSRRHAAGAHRRAHARARPAARSRAPAGRCRSGRACTTCRRAPFPAQATYGRRLVRLGAQLCAADGTLINRDFARAWLPQTLGRRRPRRRRHRDSGARAARTLRAEVRSGQRRDRLVRALRVADDDAQSVGQVAGRSFRAGSSVDGRR